ncbi:MAG: hypothetical protein QM775_35765 [Pirellulales bacterium]
MRKLGYLVALATALVSSGCCRMCCWQRGGSFHNGYCYPQMPAPALQPVQQNYAAPQYAQPCACQ